MKYCALSEPVNLIAARHLVTSGENLKNVGKNKKREGKRRKLQNGVKSVWS